MRCKAKKTNGEPCRRDATPGCAWCIAHNPNHDAARREGRRKGGLVAMAKLRPATLPETEPDLKADSARDVKEGLIKVVNWVLKGKVAAPVGNCAIIGLQAIARVMDVELAERVEAIEAQLAAGRNGRALR